jgi:hypothetical protein
LKAKKENILDETNNQLTEKNIELNSSGKFLADTLS